MLIVGLSILILCALHCIRACHKRSAITILPSVINIFFFPWFCLVLLVIFALQTKKKTFDLEKKNLNHLIGTQYTVCLVCAVTQAANHSTIKHFQWNHLHFVKFHLNSFHAVRFIWFDDPKIELWQVEWFLNLWLALDCAWNLWHFWPKLF